MTTEKSPKADVAGLSRRSLLTTMSAAPIALGAGAFAGGTVLPASLARAQNGQPPLQ
jgi:hypothetical protein